MSLRIVVTSFFFVTYLSRPLTATALTCKDKIAFAPLTTYSLGSDTLLYNLVEKNLQTNFSSLECNVPILVQNETFHFFDYVGFSKFYSQNLDRLDIRQIRLLKKRTGASYLLEAQLNRLEKTMTINLFAIEKDFKLQPVYQSYQSLNDLELEQINRQTYFEKISRLVPNSLTIGLTNSEVIYDSKDNYQLIETKGRAKLPPILSSITVSKIEHASSYHLFDYGFTLFPGGYIFAIDQSDTFYNSEDNEVNSVVTEAYGGCSNINVYLSGHSPIGTTYLALGAGPCLTQTRSDFDKNRTRLNGAVRLNFGHRIFLSLRSFLFFEADMLFFTERLFDTPYSRSSSVSRSTLGLGWYFPAVEKTFVEFIQEPS